MNKRKNLLLVWGFLFLFISTLWNCKISNQKAAIRKAEETIKTYPFSDPDPTPILTRSDLWGKGARLYPYSFFDKFDKTGQDQVWTVVHLENPYIKLSVLPQVGGKVWGASEKSTGKEFIYKNHVLKFREIALRGPWTSGGVEFNFGIVGHAPSTATPVDYMIRKNRDGSVSCIVGGIDLPSRTRWSVTITLPRDKAFFETRAFWYNPSPLHQSYYSWMNSAVRTGDDLEYIFPGRFQIGHNYSVPLKPWPASEKGRILSLYRNNNFGSSKSYFTVGEYENFFGGYWHDSEFGFGHWALYDDMPGQKIWIWSLARDGAIWEDLLTDADGQYSEPQAGRYLNQSDHELFTPYTADTWAEIWFPYKKIGPMVKASPYGVLNVTFTDDNLKVSVCPLQKIKDDLVIKVAEKEIYREHLNLKPMTVFERTIPFINGSSNLHVSISSKLEYSGDPQANDLSRPIRFHRFDKDTIEGLFLAASHLEKERNYHLALQNYLACLEREPFHMRALCRVAELYYRRAEYEKALQYVYKALENVMYDPEASYIYGVISRRLGNQVDAKETLGWASRSMEYRSGAYCQMAEIYLLERNFDLALEYTRRSLNSNVFNINAYQVKAISLRKLRQNRKARDILNKILEIEPLNHLARFELYMLEPSREKLNHFQSMIRSEFPHEDYMEMALFYVRLGLVAEAVQMLELAPGHPLVHYWIAYLLKDRNSDSSQAHLKKASSLSPFLVFPFREESIPVFLWALKTMPSDWKAKYYLGLILWSKGRIFEALDIFESTKQPDYAPFYISRGYLYKETDSEKALADFKTAVKIDNRSWRVWHNLIDYYNQEKKFDEALNSSLRASELFPDEIHIQMELIGALMKNQHYEQSAQLLEKIETLPYEGAKEIHNLFVENWIQLALVSMKKSHFSLAIQRFEKSMTYPERLGTGRPHDPDFREQEYLMALIYEKLGDKNKAGELKKSVCDYTLKNWGIQRKNQYYGGLVLIEFGDKDRAKPLLDGKMPSKEILDLIKEMKR